MTEHETQDVIRDGALVHQFRCPQCRTWGDIDEDQAFGRVSILCDCGFHETIDLHNEPFTVKRTPRGTP